MSLNQDSITFGKYKGTTLARVLKDRSYCSWLVEQEWFQTNYEFLYNRVKEYDPRVYFLRPYDGDTDDFIDSYPYFNLYPVDELKIDLASEEIICYEYYLRMIQELKTKIYLKLENEDGNPFDIKAPTKWLQRFESESGLKRQEFKDFMAAYELPNIPYVIERIKKEGGVEYKGAQSFNIAKARSEAQEQWWGEVLKSKYGEDLGTQYKYEKCIFDFLNISTNTIFECKLGMKDFNQDQHIKYKLALKEYRIIYLISRDCVIEMERKSIYTNNPDKYKLYLHQIPFMKDPSYLDKLIGDFTIVEVEDLSILFGLPETNAMQLHQNK